MKNFIKVVLLAAVLLVAIKLSPVIFLGAILGLMAAALLGAVGLSLLAVLAAVALALAVALSPMWIPVLVVMGLVRLLKKSGQNATSIAA